MKVTFLYTLFITFLICSNLKASEKDSLAFQTQLSFASLVNPTSLTGVHFDARVLPQLDYLRDFSGDRRLSAEVSANVNAFTDIPIDRELLGGSLRLYRAWVRFSTQRNEIRAGLQQLNFGSASLLRPLQWFDGLNPTDPLRMTNGVWGVLDRIYFKNNSTLWLWCLSGNTEYRVWDLGAHSTVKPELGFRFQQPVPSGEVAFSFNHRTMRADYGIPPTFQETNLGLDGKWDLGPGVWFEDSYRFTSKASPFKSGWNSLTVGSDITTDFMNGLSFTFEHMLNTNFSETNPTVHSINFSALSANWPISIFHRLSAIVLYNWESDLWFRYLTWSADFDRGSLYLIGFWNPNLSTSLLSLGSGYYSNYGFQLMYVLQL